MLGLRGLCLLIVLLSFLTGTALAAQSKTKPSQGAKPKRSAKLSPSEAAAQRYAEAIASGDRVAAGQLDFACQFRMVSTAAGRPAAFPPATDPVYADCWEPLEQTHQTAVESREQDMDELWPGKGQLVFFREPLTHYGSSFFVMDLLGLSPPGSGLRAEVLNSQSLPAASFRLTPDAPVVAAPATLVRMRVTYKDPLTSPVSYAPGAYHWTNTVKRPRAALKAVTVSWVVMSGLKRFGFPGETAVVNLPVSSEDGARVPFVTATSSYVEDSAAWWEPADAPGLLIAAVGRAVQFPEQRERIALLNRVLIIDPYQPEALTALTRDLYQTLLRAAEAEHKITLDDPELAERLNEFHWDASAQTRRMDISLGMEMGGFAKPTPADYLYRLIPAMEKLAKVRTGDLENRLRLGMAYRWNNDQPAAIATHEALLKDVPRERYALRARVLIELAWSRIAKVSWNRNFDDPAILQAYKEAEEAYKFTDRPLDKFAAAYTMAYSLAFTPRRDNRAMLEHLTEAQAWYRELPGASPAAWRYLLSNDTLKGVLASDPIFKPLLSSREK
jgi:hypothetical protein